MSDKPEVVAGLNAIRRSVHPMPMTYPEIEKILTTFYLSPVSAASLEPVLRLAERLNPDLRAHLNAGDERAEPEGFTHYVPATPYPRQFTSVELALCHEMVDPRTRHSLAPTCPTCKERLPYFSGVEMI